MIHSLDFLPIQESNITRQVINRTVLLTYFYWLFFSRLTCVPWQHVEFSTPTLEYDDRRHGQQLGPQKYHLSGQMCRPQSHILLSAHGKGFGMNDPQSDPHDTPFLQDPYILAFPLIDTLHGSPCMKHQKIISTLLSVMSDDSITPTTKITWHFVRVFSQTPTGIFFLFSAVNRLFDQSERMDFYFSSGFWC